MSDMAPESSLSDKARSASCRCDGRYDGCDHGRSCASPAGSSHSPVFCQPCDVQRRAHITARLEGIVRDFTR